MPLQSDNDQVPSRAAAGTYSPPKPKASEVDACQFSSWYITFRNIDGATIQNNTTAKKKRKNVTIESTFMRPLPSEFIEYLMSDGVVLPECANRVSSCMNDGNSRGNNVDDGWDSVSSSDGEDANITDGRGESIQKYSFPELTAWIQDALTKLGGERKLGCMPKLNWSSPKDATWVNCGSLKCTTAGDVYLLLKSSDFIAFDLDKAWGDLASDGNVTDGMNNLEVNSPEVASNGSNQQFKQSTSADNGHGEKPNSFEYELVLRKWCNLHPSMEFRCFVYNSELSEFAGFNVQMHNYDDMQLGITHNILYATKQ